MNLQSETEIEFFIQMFEEWSLPAKEWTHEAHLLTATSYLLKYEYLEATDRIRQNIKAFNIAKGGKNTDTEGYHETITQFYMERINAELKDLNAKASVHQKITHILASPLGDTRHIFEYFTKETLFSKEARLNLVVGDKKDFFSNSRIAL